jgi:hypothetical protein
MEQTERTETVSPMRRRHTVQPEASRQACRGSCAIECRDRVGDLGTVGFARLPLGQGVESFVNGPQIGAAGGPRLTLNSYDGTPQRIPIGQNAIRSRVA